MVKFPKIDGFKSFLLHGFKPVLITKSNSKSDLTEAPPVSCHSPMEETTLRSPSLSSSSHHAKPQPLPTHPFDLIVEILYRL